MLTFAFDNESNFYPHGTNTEKDLAAEIVTELTKSARANGIAVIESPLLCDTFSPAQCLRKRQAAIKTIDLDLFVSIHCLEQQAGLPSAIAYAQSTAGKIYAREIVDGLEAIGLRNQGISHATVEILAKSEIAGTIVELRFNKLTDLPTPAAIARSILTSIKAIVAIPT